MNRKKIYSCFFSAAVLFFATTQLQAQTIQSPDEKTAAFFQGVYVGTDLFSPVNYLFGGKNVAFQLAGMANLDNKYFPAVEIGIGKGNTTTERALSLSTSPSMYARIGLNYSMLNRRNEDFFYLGLRYGFSSFRYAIGNIVLSDPYWKDIYVGNPETQSSTVTWGEFQVGIQVRMTGNFYMGLGLAYKVKFTEKNDNEHLKPWYIPGYGSSKWGIMYSVYYKLPY
ncbi:MAG: DUF6048 family protein [Bacteroidales bacterium]|jgi:hypothetical protein|nr:DUF6048 family protein [Bacteroidales bacterium]